MVVLEHQVPLVDYVYKYSSNTSIIGLAYMYSYSSNTVVHDTLAITSAGWKNSGNLPTGEYCEYSSKEAVQDSSQRVPQLWFGIRSAT